MLVTYPELLSRLYARQKFGIRPGFTALERALTQLGSPHLKLKAIHIAGTNGKGSVSAMVEALLREAGLKTGLFTSPHLHRFTERFRISGHEVDPSALCKFADQVFAFEELTFFEIATLLAFLLFAEMNLDVVVLETGLGGTWDATNVIAKPLATAITSVALDHAEILGSTLAEIAREKSGIFKPGVPAVVAVADESARGVVRERAGACGAPLYQYGHDFVVNRQPLAFEGMGQTLALGALALPGAHQEQNAAMAVATTIASKLVPDAAWSTGLAERALADVQWPSRLEWLRPHFLIDAAHNPEGARSLAEFLRARGVAGCTAIFGALQEKDVVGLIAPLRPLVRRWLLCPPASPRALSIEKLQTLLPQAEPCRDVDQALALARNDEFVLAYGSIFLVAQIRAIILGERTDPVVAQDPARLSPA